MLSPKRLLRSPRTIVAELVLLALAGLASTAVTQAPTPAERGRLALEHPLAAAAVRLLGLDHVFQTWWLLCLVALAGASLSIVLVEQWRRLAREWRALPTEASFRSAPHRAEFLRPARGAATRLESRHRIGLAGSPLFHLGLLVVLLAGIGRMLFGVDAVVHLYEGEVLEPRPEAFGAQWRGLLARPLSLGVPVELRALLPGRYPSGQLARLEARVALGGPAPREEVLAINAPLDLGPDRLYLSSRHGCAAFLEIEWQGATEREVAMLDEAGPREFEASQVRPGGLRLRLRARAGPGGERPAELELRVLGGHALLAGATLRPGEGLELPGGGRVVLRDLRWWARLVAARDLSTWPAYAGFALALGGAILMFSVVKVDAAVIVRREGEWERVSVALRPERFSPLFADRFRRLVREEGGPAG
ncbi:MAG TPA: cytochrome c biogenesis protein ResB [Anaeromyxobacteraceae bacterium]|nr:cytochrome c biogenesis protein ResB [Anaeromyxobacteraceae bacterium]